MLAAMAMQIPNTSLTDAYNAARVNAMAEDLTDSSDQIRRLEIQVGHLRTLNRALVEYLARQADLTPQTFLDQLPQDHTPRSANEPIPCKSCGTLISPDSRACYSCGQKIEADVYILG